MVRIVVAAVAVVALLAVTPVWACDDAAHARELRAQTRALEAQVASLRQIERVERDRLKAEDRARRNLR